MFDPLRHALARFGNLGTALFAIGLWEVGARIGFLGLDPKAYEALVLSVKPNPLLYVYGLLTGGAFSRGALLALGIVPYLSARIFMRLARIVNPDLESMWHRRAGRERVREWTRRLTLGLAGVQSIGFAEFLQNSGMAPEGFGFVLRTVLILTSGSVLAMLVTEQLAKPSDADLPDEESEAEADAADAFGPEALSAGPAAEIIRDEAIHEPVLRTRD